MRIRIMHRAFCFLSTTKKKNEEFKNEKNKTDM